MPVLAQCIQQGMQDPVQAKLLVTPEGAQGKAAEEITQVVTSPTGLHVAAGHADGTVRIWNIDTGDCEVRHTSRSSQIKENIALPVVTYNACHLVYTMPGACLHDLSACSLPRARIGNSELYQMPFARMA